MVWLFLVLSWPSVNRGVLCSHWHSFPQCLCYQGCSAVGSLALVHRRPGEVSDQNPSLPWSQAGFRQHREEHRALSQSWAAAGMGDSTAPGPLNTLSVATAARARAKQPVVCVSVCLSALLPAELTAWLVSLRTRRVLWAWAMSLVCSTSLWGAWGWPWWWHWSSSATSPGPSPSEWNSPRTRRTSNLPLPPTPRITLPTEKATTCTAQKVWKSRGRLRAGTHPPGFLLAFLYSCLCRSVVCTRKLLQEVFETPSCGSS